MISNNNPLKQYFRRPAVYLKLPSDGFGYAEGLIDFPDNRELPVYPMTAIDDISARTPDALYNGTALADLIKSCIPSIKDPWSVLSIDMDAILISIKAASGGATLDIETECPNCKEVATYSINLIGLLTSIEIGDYNTPMVVGDLSIKFRPLSYREMNQASIAQFELQKVLIRLESINDDDEKNRISKESLEKMTDLTMSILSKTIEYIDTPGSRVNQEEFILDFLRNCDRNMFISLREFNTKLKEVSELKPMKIECTSCAHQYEQPFTLSPVDFFD